MISKQLKFSVSPNFYNKYKRQDDSSAFTKGFEPVEFTVSELAETVAMGYAFSYQYAGGVRKAENFLASDILAVDVDVGRTVEEALNDQIVKAYGSLLYTTPSHSPDRHRYRLVFVLPRTITDANELKAATYALARRLGGDMAATDAARIFYGSQGCRIEELNRSIDDKFLSELIAEGKVVPVSDSIANKDRAVPSRSLPLDRDYQFTTGKGELVKMGDVQEATPVYCPFHRDENPSGFISLNQNKSTFFHCSTCRTTHWMKGVEPPRYDFNSFENFMRALKDNPMNREHSTPMALAIDPVWYSRNIHFSDDRYFTLHEIQPGVTFIKSPKGTGKTKYLADVLENVLYTSGSATLESFEDHCDFEDKEQQPIYTNKRVLLIGHRQALIGDLCKRLGLNCYLDDPADNKADTRYRKTRYGVCLDSLWKVQGCKYDLVIIDEVEQVLSHFLSKTIGHERLVIFDYFKCLIRQAKSVVSLDADLGWISFDTLTKLRSKEFCAGETPVHVYINSYKPVQKSIQMYALMDQLIEHIKRSVLEGKRVFVTSNSKTKIKALEESIKDLSAQTKKPIPLITITSENSKERETQQFIKNIKKEILKYQVVLSSPSLGTGIDITFKNASSEIDCVYGIFENLINSHTEIDQQLARVRHPKEVHVWVSAARFNFETDFGVVKDDYLSNNLLVNMLNGYQSKTASEAHQFDVFISMAALITAYQRASKNNLRQNFIDYKKEQNWRVDDVAVDALLTKHGKEFYKTGVLINTAEEIDAAVKAKPLSRMQYIEVLERCNSNNDIVTMEERQSIYRTSLELFYRRPISKELIEQDDKGAYRRAVRAFEVVQDKSRITQMIQEKNASSMERRSRKANESLFYDRNSEHILLYEILATTPFFSDGVFDSAKCFSTGDLKTFSECALKLKPFVETQLEVATARDVKTKPIQHLGKILKGVGLKTEVVTTVQSGGQKTRFYKLSDRSLKNMLEITARRADPNETEWDFLHRLHGFSSIEDDLL